MPDLPYWAAAQQYGNEYGVDPRMVEAVMHQESGGNPSAHSSAGAEGLMQLMPSTAAGLGVHNPWNPMENLRGGVEYLGELLKGFHGNVSEALAGYNAGAGAVEKYHGVPPYRETQQYVKLVEAAMKDLGDTHWGVAQQGQDPNTPTHIDFERFHSKPEREATAKNIGETSPIQWFLTPAFFSSMTKALQTCKPYQSIWSMIHP